MEKHTDNLRNIDANDKGGRFLHSKLSLYDLCNSSADKLQLLRALRGEYTADPDMHTHRFTQEPKRLGTMGRHLEPSGVHRKDIRKKE